MIDKLIKYQDSQVGYLEKKSNKDLEPKKGPNVGNKNFTKYADDLIKKIGKPFRNGEPWCVMFQEDSFVEVFGVEQAKQLLYVWTMSCGDLKTAFKNKKRYFKDGQVGDLVIFEWYDSEGILHRHIGLVYKADKNYIYTIEGNTSCKTKPKKQGEDEDVIENGGGVFKKSYSRKHAKICGYCRPEYPEQTHIAKPVLKKGSKGQEVKYLQQNLNQAINAKLDIDGSFGSKTEKAVKDFQKKYKLAVDGSYGPKTAAKMTEVIL